MARVEADGRLRDPCEPAARCAVRDPEAPAVDLHVYDVLSWVYSKATRGLAHERYAYKLA